MKVSSKAKLYLSILFIIVIAFAVTTSSCVQSEDTNPVANDPQPEDNSFLFTSSVAATHIIGQSPCPQRIAEITTFCGRTENGCTADSAIITNPHPGSGLIAYFENNKQTSPLEFDPLNGVNLNIDFTCNVAQSFKHKYNVEFYNKGVKIDEQELTVDMKVE